MKNYKSIYGIVFLVAWLSFSFANAIAQADDIAGEVSELKAPKTVAEMNMLPVELDNILNENILGKYGWYELYGGVHVVLHKNEENNFTYVKDKNGFLYSGNFWNTSNIEAMELALRVRYMKDVVAEDETRVVCLMYPTKYNEEWSDGYYGIPYNNLNEHADDVLVYFRRYNIDYIDFREEFLDQNLTMEDIFYKTDHHWTVPRAFDSTCTILEYMEERYGDDWDPKDYYKNINHYQVETYEDFYLGSQGRETGYIYSGLDDYTYICPKFDSSVTYSFVYRDGDLGKKQGAIEDVLIDKKYLDYDNIYKREMNNSYMQGICLRDSIVNEEKKDGPKVLFIRDSYSSPVATFLAPMCSQIDLIWSIHFDGDDIEEIVEDGGYDYIFVAMAIDNFTQEGFAFYQDEVIEKIEETSKGE